MNRLKIIVSLLAGCLMLSAIASCSQTRKLADGEYLLKKNKIIIKNSRTYPKSDLSAYLKQSGSGNQSFGIQSLFKEPILFNENLIVPTCNGMLRHLEYMGYYHSSIDTMVVRKNKKATVNYIVTLGKQYPLKEVTYSLPDSTISQILKDEKFKYSLHRGGMLSESSLEKEAERIASLLRKKGYYGFTKNYMFNFADTTAVPDSALLRIELREYTRNEAPSAARRHTRDTIRYVNYKIPANLNVRLDFLDDINLLESGMEYSEEVVNTTYQRFAGNHIFNTVNVSLTPVDSTNFVDCMIALTPSRAQNFELNMEASTNSSGLIGLSPSLTYNHFNLFGGAEVLTLGFRGNFQFKFNDPTRSNEYALTGAITFPKLLFLPFIHARTAVLPATEVSMAYNFQNRPEYTRNILSGSYGYTWSSSRNLRFSIRVPHLSIIKIFNIDDDFYSNLNSSYLQYQYQNHFDLGSSVSVYYTTNPAVNPTDSYFYIRTDLSSSGLVLNTMRDAWKENDRGQRLIWGIPYSQYLRAQVSAVETIRFGSSNQMAFAARFLAGIGYAYGNSLFTMPLEQMFYAGGANSMRGWQSRSLGPGMAPLDEKFSIYNQVGDMRIETNLEWRFPLFWKLGGALFTDIGNIWNLPKDPGMTDADYELSVFSLENLFKSTAVSWGVGARLDFGLLLVRVDLGIKGYDPEIQRWLTPKEWFGKDGFAVHLGIGYPF